jgi:hypothetical protein
MWTLDREVLVAADEKPPVPVAPGVTAAPTPVDLAADPPPVNPLVSEDSEVSPCRYEIMKKERPEPIPAPITPPKNPVTKDSEMKLNIIVLAFAPNAFRMPISFVLSRTEVNSVVMIAMNATKTEMLPIDASKVPMDDVTDVIDDSTVLTVDVLTFCPNNVVSSVSTVFTVFALDATTITPL